MKLAGLVLAIAVLFVPIGVLAHDDESQVLQSSVTTEQRRQAAKEFRDQLIEDKKQELTQARAQRIVARCEALKTRITQNSDRLGAVRTERGGLINNLVARLETFAGRVQAAGLDTTALNEDIATLKTMAAELDTLWAAYAQKLEALKSADCSDSADALHAALEAAKLAGADVRAKFKEAKDFLQSDIKPELQHIREDLASQQAE